MTGGHRSPDSGLTLIEMLIVLVILGIGSSAAMLSLRSLQGDRAAEDEALRLAAYLTLAGDEAGHVVLRVNGRLQTLAFAEPAGADVTRAAAGPDLQNLIQTDRTAAAAVRLPEADARIASYRAALNRDPYGFLTGLGVEPGPQDYVVLDVAATELVQTGLRPGDLVTALNGQPVGNIDTDIGLFDAIVTSGRLTLTAQRGGKSLTMTFPLQ